MKIHYLEIFSTDSGLYENTSVLENHHWRYGISILRESKLLNHLSPFQQSEVEWQIKSLILGKGRYH